MKALLVVVLFSLTSISYSQLDSVSCTAQFVMNPENTSGLDSISLLEPIFQVRVYLNDLDDLSRVSIRVCDSAYTHVESAITLDRSDIIGSSFLEGHEVVVNCSYLDENSDYRILIDVQNLNGAYLPVTEFIYYVTN